MRQRRGPRGSAPCDALGMESRTHRHALEYGVCRVEGKHEEDDDAEEDAAGRWCVSQIEASAAPRGRRLSNPLVSRVMLEVEVDCDELEAVEEAVDVLSNEQCAEHFVHESHVGRVGGGRRADEDGRTAGWHRGRCERERERDWVDRQTSNEGIYGDM